MRPYPTHPVPWPKIDLAPLVLVPEPEFVAPELEKLPVLRQPPLHSIPALPLSVQWEVLMRRRLGARPLFLLDISGSMCEADGKCCHERRSKTKNGKEERVRSYADCINRSYMHTLGFMRI